MGKKFDVVIGNPPYQGETKGATTRSEPIYPKFMDAAYEVAEQAVLITPARFLSNSGQTKAAWNKKMLADEHLRVAFYIPDSSQLFPGTDIKGGIAVTHRNANQQIGPIGTFLGTQTQMGPILEKVNLTDPNPFSTIVSSRALYRYSDEAMLECSNIERAQGRGTGNQITPPSLSILHNVVFFDDKPDDGYVYIQLLGVTGGKRIRRWVRRDWTNEPSSLDQWKIFVPKANNSGAFGETLSSPVVAEPGLGHTDTFMTIGSFSHRDEAESCLAYVKTKFARALLSILKTTQDNSKGKWKYIPLQDFTKDSGIDWSVPIPEIDQQLYLKYGLDNEEIDFIESNVKPMD